MIVLVLLGGAALHYLRVAWHNSRPVSKSRWAGPEDEPYAPRRQDGGRRE